MNMANTTLVEKFRSMDYGVAPEDSGLALAWLDQFQRRFGHFIGGAWCAPAQGGYFETSDPSTGDKIVFMMSHDHVRENECRRRPSRSAIPQGIAAIPKNSV